jgi:hypothetical protein
MIFAANAHSAYENRQLCAQRLSKRAKTAALLAEYHDTGELNWHYLPAWNTKALTPIFSQP